MQDAWGTNWNRSWIAKPFTLAVWCFKGRITINFVTEKCLFPKTSACSFYTRAPDQTQLFLPFNKTNEDSYCSLQGNGWGTAWFSAQTLPVQEHTSPPSLWQRWLIAASKLKLSLEISSVCTTILPLFLHPSPSKPSLCLLPPRPYTYTHCLLFYLKVTSRQLNAACGITALDRWSQLPWDKRKLGKIWEISVLKREYVHSEVMDSVQLNFNSYKGK